MATFWTHRKNLLYFAYQDFWWQTVQSLGITEEKVLERLNPAYKQGGVGNSRATRFAFWADRKNVDDENHYARLDILKRYIQMVYPRLVQEIAKEEAAEKFLTRLRSEGVKSEKVNVKVIVRKDKVSVDTESEQLTLF